MDKLILKFFGVEFHPLELIAVPLLFIFVYLYITVSNQTKIKLRNIKSKVYLHLFISMAALFVASVVLSYFYALNQKMVLKSLLKWLEIFGLAGLTFLYSSTSRKFKQLWWLLLIVYALDIIVSLVNIGLKVHVLTYTSFRHFPGYSALFLLSLVLPFVHKPLVLLATAILSLFVVLSLTRGAWIGLAGVIGYFIWRSFKRRPAVAFVSIVTVGLFLGTIIFISPIIKNVLSYKITAGLSLYSASNQERLGMALVSLNAFLERPFTGIGAENFSTYLLSSGVPEFVHTQTPETLTPHNFFLQIAAENGIIGFFALLGLLFSLYRILFSSVKTAEDTPYMQGLKFYFIPLLVSLLFGYVAGEVRLTLGLYMGLVLACLRSGVPGQPDRTKGEEEI